MANTEDGGRSRNELRNVSRMWSDERKNWPGAKFV